MFQVISRSEAESFFISNFFPGWNAMKLWMLDQPMINATRESSDQGL
ncbi:hypothetical protein ACQ86N_46265 [Puia sp. P3]